MQNVVYIKHFENGKVYVGITNDFKRRMCQHRNVEPRYKHLPLYKAMDKYDHYTEIVFESELYQDILEMEKIVIQNFKDIGVELYNITEGGSGMLGFRHSEETKQRLREMNTGENNPMYGKKLSEETKIKLREALGEKGYWYGKKLPYETRLKISEATSGEKNHFFNKKHSEETKKKIGESQPDKRGDKSPRANPKEYYEINSSRRDKFKRTCKRMGWNYLNFEEVLSDDIYVSPKGIVYKKYFYIYKSEDYERQVDWSTTSNRPREYYETNAVLRSGFKEKCKREGWNILDFTEIFSGEWYHFPSNPDRKIGKYFYKYEGGVE